VCYMMLVMNVHITAVVEESFQNILFIHFGTDLVSFLKIKDDNSQIASQPLDKLLIPIRECNGC